MIILSPGNHPTADKFWKDMLGSKPNGARTLGSAQAEHLAPIFAKYYDMMVCYASDFPFEIPAGVKRIAVMVHQNFPWVESFKVWQRTNIKFKGYEVDYFANEPKIIALIREGGGKCYYLPRFIDTALYPTFKVRKSIPELWFGNPWNEFKGEFEMYKATTCGKWICHGELGEGDKVIKKLDRYDTLLNVARAKKVWAIGVSQLEAQHYGCEVVSYRGPVLPFYDQKKIKPYTLNLLNEIWGSRGPGFGK